MRTQSAATLPAPFSRPFKILRPLAAQRLSDGDHYDIEMMAATADILPGTPTPIWGYNGTFPGPLIVAERGRMTHVRQRNSLTVPTTVHLHGGHVPPEMDGHATDLIAPGGEKTYRYPNNQRATTLWFHDHAMHATGRNLNNGLLGVYLVRDPGEDALGLPNGERDLVLVLTDRVFEADGRMAYSEGTHDGFVGDVPLVNGVIQPALAVEGARYRLRLLNASNSRRYRVNLKPAYGTLSFTQVGSDGGLLAAPVLRDAIDLSPAERVDVIVDFSGVDPGTRVVLGNAGTGRMTELMAFEVGARASDAAKVPAVLSTIAPLPAATVTRTVSLSQTNGVWMLQGHGFDEAIVDFTPRLGGVETWALRNPTAVGHPMHIHLVQFQILDRDGKPPPAWEAGWKDTVFVNAAETVRVAARFDGWPGTYIYHCHNLEHEDHDMMSQFRVKDVPRVAGSNRSATAAAAALRAYPTGAPVALIATSGGFADALAGGPAAAKLGGPVLLTDVDRLPDETIDALGRLKPTRILVLGGTRAVSAAVETQLRAYGQVTRLAGESRYATATAVSREAFTGPVATVYVATGTGYADALAGGAAAAADGVPLLLVERDRVPDATASELTRLAPGRIVVLGGTGAISEATKTTLATFARDGAQRLSGDSRFSTAAAVCAARWPGTASTVYVATGAGFADALAGVPAAAVEDAPLLLVERDRVPDATATQLRRLSPQRIVILGGPSAISETTADLLAAHLP